MFAFIVWMSVFAAPASAAVASSDFVQEFRQRDQALLDAFAPGDVKVWNAALAAEAVYVDENGEVMNRADFLKQLQPLPPGASGTIAISAYSVSQSGDVATVVHTDDEQELYHGQHLTAQYLTTETWQRQNGEWKLLLVHAYAILREPKTTDLPAVDLDAYVGHYAAAPDLAYTIRREGDHLLGERPGRPATPLKAEVRDVFFATGQLRVRKIFQRDDAGRIVGFVDRREGSDLVWKRVP